MADASPRAFPVSIKGVVVRDGSVLLLKNGRGEWELPGGRIEPGETPRDCVAREVAEESGWAVRAGPILDSWLHEVVPGRHVFIVTYGCRLASGSDPAQTAQPVLSAEHTQAGLFPESDVPGLRMPAGYKRSIASWFARLRTGQAGTDDA